MDLKEWMSQTNLEQKMLAKILKTSQGYISRLVRKDIRPSLERCYQISAITGGKVSVAEILGINIKQEINMSDIEIKVVNFESKISGFRMGFLEIEYGELTMKCELIAGKENFWIRMPISYRTDGTKFYKNINWWKAEEISDRFQKEVLRQLEEKFREALVRPTPEQITEARRAIKHKKKNFLSKKVASSNPSNKEEPRARNTSKFQKKFSTIQVKTFERK